MASNGFSYSNEDGHRIITSSSLMDNLSLDTPNNSDAKGLYNELKHLREKDIKLDLNAISLSDYWKKGYIPRGLRIKKFPAYNSKDNPDFTKKWEAILNKCSSDLMLLLIEQSLKDQQLIKQEIETIEKKISELTDPVKITYDTKLTEHVNKFAATLRLDKVRKFQRDEEDYKEDNVYSWNRSNKTHSQEPRRRHPRTVSWNFTSDEDDSDVPTPRRNQEGDFLEERPRTDADRWTHRGRGREGGGAAAKGTSRKAPPQIQRDYPLRSSQQRGRR